jgi:hypothetical protein
MTIWELLDMVVPTPLTNPYKNEKLYCTVTLTTFPALLFGDVHGPLVPEPGFPQVAVVVSREVFMPPGAMLTT